LTPRRAAHGKRTKVSAAEARRIALGAQGFTEPRPAGEPSGWDLRRVIDRTGLLQIDSVNVLERAHYIPAFSRLGPYSREMLERLAFRAPRQLFEYWGHEASLIPVTTQPLLRWRMDRAADEAWGGMRRIKERRPELIDQLEQLVRERGPVAVSDLELEPKRKAGPWWDWSDTKRAMEYLFWSGRVTSARRRRFERLYDVPERVLPKAVLQTPTPDVEEAQRGLLRIAARSHGIAAEIDLRDYFRLGAAEAKPRVAELVESGELIAVEVEGWGRTPGYLWSGARIPRSVEARALVGPFDSLVWERSRNRRIFGFDFRLEIYVPAPKRVHGYYVLPFLLGDRLVARVDLKADRASKTLRARAIHLEEHAPPETREALAEELQLMAGWLGLESVGS
jgi:uncharacterized protein YcaQ